MTGKNEMMQTDETECEDDLSSSAYYGDGWQIVGYTCSRHFGPEWRAEREDDKGIILLRGLYGKNGRLEQIMRMIVQGRGTRDISRATHSTGRTVRKYRGILQKLTSSESVCACGKPANHQSQCDFKLTGGRKRSGLGLKEALR